jgi:hypothetical protein
MIIDRVHRNQAGRGVFGCQSGTVQRLDQRRVVLRWCVEGVEKPFVATVVHLRYGPL